MKHKTPLTIIGRPNNLLSLGHRRKLQYRTWRKARTEQDCSCKHTRAGKKT